MRAKYGVLDCDFYNFDKTGFMMGVICPGMVVTRLDRRGRGKAVQPGNCKWATAIRLAGPDCKTGLDRTGLLTKQSGPVHGPESQFPVCNLFSDRTAVCQNAFRPDCGLEINFSDRKIYY